MDQAGRSTTMKRLVPFIVAAALLAVGGTQALARTTLTQTKTVTVVMHDPGCHWFSVAGHLQKTLTVTGTVRLVNRDEAALIVASRAGVRHEAVGKTITLTKGVYAITMVRQHPDDNHLKLTVR
jgi:hypothetical protein